MNGIVQLGVIGLVSVAAAGATYWIKGPPERGFVCDPASLKPGEVCLEQIPPDAKILWVDARSRQDWEKSGVPGSVLWNLDPGEDMQAFETEAAMRIMETPRVIVYCGDENCGLSRQVAERIKGLGLEAEISVLHGGWRALKEGGKIKDSSPVP
jgi:rhodanese-related sulfurtransferase